MDKKYFLKNSDHSGRFIIQDLDSGKEWWIEPIDNSGRPADWGDINPATKKLEGQYGSKHKGSITEKESLINEENGFTNINYGSWDDIMNIINNQKK